jgi:hypothetical protein
MIKIERVVNGWCEVTVFRTRGHHYVEDHTEYRCPHCGEEGDVHSICECTLPQKYTTPTEQCIRRQVIEKAKE